MNAKRLSLILIPLLLLLAACGARKLPESQKVNSQVAVKETQVVKATQVVAATAVVGETSGKLTGDAAAPASTAASAAGGETALLNYTPADVRMVIKDVEMELLVEDTDRAIDMVTQLTAEYGGYILSSQTWYDSEYKYASMRVSVPSASFENALTNMRHIGMQVLRETGSGQDVSAEYTDLQSRLTNLEATAARVREFLNAAQTIEESLKINQQLSELEVQIEQIKGQMHFYEGRSAYSTITVNLTPQRPTPTPAPTAMPTPIPPTPTPKPGWSPATTFGQASGVLANMGRAVVDLLIWLVLVLIPVVVVIGLPIWFISRWISRKI